MRKKGLQRRLKLLTIILICFVGWAGVTFWNQSGQLEAKLSQLADLEEKLAEVKKVNEGYQQEISRLNDPEYIEQRLRKDLHYTKDEEILFIQTR